MMLALWSVVIGFGVSGYLMDTEQFWGDGRLEEIHELLANVLIALIALHVVVAVLMSLLSKQNLIAAMITGKKKVPDSVLEDTVTPDKS